MAGRRIAKSMVDWAAFAEKVPAEQYDFYRAFKSKSDMFASRVHKYPENIQPIDFEHYKSKIANKALVAEFEKAYKSVSVPFPKDKDNLKGALEKEEQAAMEESKKHVQNVKGLVESTKALMNKLDSLPKPDEMTLDMMAYYFPDKALNPWVKPSFWPHTKSYQPENDPETIN